MKIQHSNNRLLIVDWGSLSYHQLFALVSKKNSATYFELDNPEAELFAWNSNMLDKMLGYIKDFNPKDILLTLEGNNLWRFDYCKKYYEDNAKVYYDTTGYYLLFDNFIYKFFKVSDGKIEFNKLDIVEDIIHLPKKEKKISELPERIQEMFWETVLPKYKGNRAKQTYWPFVITKKKWKLHKEEFAKKLAGIFRLHAIQTDAAEGDDVIYVGVEYWGKKYDSIILITCDSDMNQLLDRPNLQIYDHKKQEFTICEDPKVYLELKVLSGDKADNVNGIALPNKKTQLGLAGATNLYESVGNCFEKAKDEGWDNQYLRNKKLIDLSNIPTHIQREICDFLDKSNPELEDLSLLYSLNVTDKIKEEIMKMKNLGFYALNSLKRINKDPNFFNPNLFSEKDEYKNDKKTNIQRKFDDISSLVEDPLTETADLI